MEQDSKQEHSLEKSIEILSEMTKKDIQRLYNLESFSNIKVAYTNRYGWILKKKNVLPQGEQNF